MDVVKTSISSFSKSNHMKNHVTCRFRSVFSVYKRETEENDRCNVTPFSKYPPLSPDSVVFYFPARFYRISVNERAKG